MDVHANLHNLRIYARGRRRGRGGSDKVRGKKGGGGGGGGGGGVTRRGNISSTSSKK